MVNVKTIVRRVLIASVGLFCIAGIGYFAPAFRQQNTLSSPNRADLIREIAYNRLPELTDGITQYDAYLAQTAHKALQLHLPDEKLTVIVKSETTVKQDKTVLREIIPDSGVIKSEHIEQKNNDIVIQDKVFDYSTKITKSHSVSLDVQKISLLLFIEQQENTPQLLHSNEKLSEIMQAAIGYDEARGDTVQIVFLPKSAVKAGFFGQNDTQIRQIIAVILICFLCIFIFAGFLIPWIIKNFYRVKPIQLPDKRTVRDAYQNQIIGNMEENLILKAQKLCAAMPEAAVNILRNRMAEETKQVSRTDLFSPAQKAAIILLCLGEKTIKNLFKYLTEAEIFSLSRLMASLGHVKAIDIQPILLAFCQSMNAPQDIRQTKPLVESMIKNTLPVDKAETLLYEMNMATGGKSVWDKINKIPTPQLSAYLSGEYPQTAAVILYHLTTEKAAAVLAETDEETGARILVRLSALQYMNPDHVRLIEINLEKQIEALMSKPQNIGVQKASAILSLLDKKTQSRYMRSMETFSPQTAGSLAKRVLMFDDLSRWSAADLNTLMKHIDTKTLILALSNAEQTTKEAFARVMSPQKWGNILKKINNLPTGKVQDIDASQRAVIQIAYQLVESKKCKGSMI